MDFVDYKHKYCKYKIKYYELTNNHNMMGGGNVLNKNELITKMLTTHNNIPVDYKYKYSKYKTKYCELKNNQFGGGDVIGKQFLLRGKMYTSFNKSKVLATLTSDDGGNGILTVEYPEHKIYNFTKEFTFATIMKNNTFQVKLYNPESESDNDVKQILNFLPVGETSLIDWVQSINDNFGKTLLVEKETKELETVMIKFQKINSDLLTTINGIISDLTEFKDQSIMGFNLTTARTDQWFQQPLQNNLNKLKEPIQILTEQKENITERWLQYIISTIIQIKESLFNEIYNKIKTYQHVYNFSRNNKKKQEVLKLINEIERLINQISQLKDDKLSNRNLLIDQSLKHILNLNVRARVEKTIN